MHYRHCLNYCPKKLLCLLALSITFSVEALAQQKSVDEAAKKSRPNIIVIMTDDAGYADMGFSGNVFGEANFATPHIDKLASRGTNLTQAYVTASVCSPSRAGMLTGRYQQRFGHEYNLPVKPEPGDTEEYHGLNINEKTMADYLQKAGYKTALIGKWHLGLAEQFHPNNRGFDEFYGILGGGRSYWANEKRDSDYRRVYRNKKVEIHDGYLTDKLNDEAIKFISDNQDQPFFMFLSHIAVHAPMQAKPSHLETLAHIKDKNRRTLAAMTLALDESIGKLTTALDQLALTENTLIFFLNDNGGPSDANYSINTPFSGVKGTLAEGGIRVPFTVSWPGHIPSGKQYQLVTSSLDILPTALAAAGITTPVKNTLDGVNLIPFLTGQVNQIPHETLYWRRAAFAAIREGDYKLIRYPDRPAVLYNISIDISEKNNLANDQPQRVVALMKKLFEWETQLQAPLFITHSKWIKQNRERYSKYTHIDEQ